MSQVVEVREYGEFDVYEKGGLIKLGMVARQLDIVMSYWLLGRMIQSVV
jgi:hypothetical protein